jgi:hypothetical protein
VFAKPDITAADGTAVTGVGGFASTFFGTSAAAPHAGAIAALLKQGAPAFTNAQIRTALQSSALDVAGAGVDRDSGAGIVMAYQALQAAGVTGTTYLAATTITATENPGNGNGVINVGEGGQLMVTLTNLGLVGATGIQATLTTSTPGITVTVPAQSTYPDLAVGASGANATPFRFTVASNAACPLTISFTLTLTYAGTGSPSTITIPVETGGTFSITTTLDTTAPVGPAGVTAATGLQTGRLNRFSPATTCTTVKPNPGLFDTGSRRFDSYAFNTCPENTGSCANVRLSGTNNVTLYSVAYAPTFVPATPNVNFVGDGGISANTGAPYLFSVGSGPRTFTLAVNEVIAGVGIGTQYTLTLAGACATSCATPNQVPVAVVANVTVVAGGGGTASASINNGSYDPDGDSLTITQTPPGPYAVGTTSVLLTVTDPKGATSQASANVTVLASTAAPISVSDAALFEGASGPPSFAAFRISLGAASTLPVSVNWSTANGTATAGSDYTASGGTVNFAVGATSQTVLVPILGDATAEPDETFVVNLTAPVNGTIVRPQGTGTIGDDDGATGVRVSLDASAVAEGNTGTTVLAFDVRLSTISALPVTVSYATSNDTALAGGDYAGATGTLTIPAGVSSKAIILIVNGDTVIEPDETLTVTLGNPVNATLFQATNTGVIQNDDPAPAAGLLTQYRLFLPFTGEHLFTTDLSENDILPSFGWQQEGAAYRMFTGGVYNGALTVPMYRLYNSAIAQHHWTTDSNEVKVLAATAPWTYEGIPGYLVPTPIAGTVPLYRMAFPNPPLHLWTIDGVEYAFQQTQGWVAEGAIGYALTP